IAPGHHADVTLTVHVGKLTSCTICNTASATANEKPVATLSPQLCVTTTPGTDPGHAHASGNALAAKIIVAPLSINTTITPVSSTQSGIGTDSHGGKVVGLAVPPPAGSIAIAKLLSATSTSTVFPGATGSNNTSTAETLGVNLVA